MRSRRCTFPLLALGLMLASAAVSSGQGPTTLADPRFFGFDIPPGTIRPADGERVLTADRSGAPVVAKTHVNVGDARIVLLPDGQLVARKPGEAEPTDRPFQPLQNEELLERLKAEFPGFKAKQTKNYTYLFSTSDVFAFGTSQILESMLTGVEKWAIAQKLPTHDPEVPLVIVMFKTEADFQAYRRMPSGVVAYYDPLSNRIAVYEESPKLAGRPDLLLKQAISTIAHEGTHQILHNIGVQQRLSIWPMWLSEGLAEFLAPTEVNKKLRWKGAGYVNDLRMFELEQYVKAHAAEEPKGDTVRNTVLAARLSSTGYATAWSLTHYLATKKKSGFSKYLCQIAKTGPLQGAVEVVPPGIVPGNMKLFEQQFGGDYLQMEKDLIAHLKRQKYSDPFAGMPHFVAMLTWHDGKKQQRDVATFHSPILAAKWVREMRERNPAIGDDGYKIEEYPNRLQAEAVGRAWERGK
jgi:hypothetical protein